MECWWQAAFNGVDKLTAKKLINYSGNISRLILMAQHECGLENTILIPNIHDSVSSDSVTSISQKIYKALGIHERLISTNPLPYFGFTNTVTALRLLKARQVRHNDWPRLDYSAYMLALQELDKDWGPEPITPLVYRQALLQKGAEDQKRLEQLLNLPEHSLDAPDWYGTLPETEDSVPLLPERLEAFAEALPQIERNVLLKRFANDEEFLSTDQQALQQALMKVQNKKHTVISDMREQPVLTVMTMTQNHKNYIGPCIESVLMQKTDFPVRHLVLDHYSEDETPHIINTYAEKYPSIIPVLLNNYQHTYHNVYDLFMRCHSEYAALCDGDDYFTDPLKLQKQVDFLKKHPRCSLCFHPVSVEFEDGEQDNFVYPPLSMLPRGVREEYHLADLFQGNMIQTNSVVYRWRFKDGLPEWFRHDVCPGDWYWHLLHAETGRIGFIPEVMSVYRRHKKAAYSNSFISSIEHRRNHGMAELATYQVVNEHFKGRYFIKLAGFSNGVFADFFKLSAEKGDDTLLNEACQKFPDFARYFLQSLKIVRKDQAGTI